jgi:PAS domain-containing protein
MSSSQQTKAIPNTEDATHEAKEIAALRARVARLEGDLVSSRVAALATVFDNVTQGVAMFNAERSLVIWNKHYQEILKFPGHMMKVGTGIRDFALLMAERGDYGPGEPETLVEERLKWLWLDATKRTEVTIPGGRTYDILKKKTDDGGLVITFADNTDRKLAAEAL